MVCIIPEKQETLCFNRWSYLKYSVKTGVPQGSVLGPLLFLLYINDLNKSIKNHFADDTNILLSNKSVELLAKNMNQDPKNLSQWLKANKLSLNVTKK